MVCHQRQPEGIDDVAFRDAILIDMLRDGVAWIGVFEYLADVVGAEPRLTPRVSSTLQSVRIMLFEYMGAI